MRACHSFAGWRNGPSTPCSALGQDQMRIVKQRLLEMIPELSIFLDVDDLEDISDIEGYITRSEMVLIFCSQGYFRSKNCMREIRSSVEKGIQSRNYTSSIDYMIRQ